MSLSLSLPAAFFSRFRSTYQHLAVLLLAVLGSGQRGALYGLVAPLVGILEARLQEVDAGAEPDQHQHGHQQVDGHEPVQKHQGDGGGTGISRRKEEIDWLID